LRRKKGLRRETMFEKKWQDLRREAIIEKRGRFEKRDNV